MIMPFNPCHSREDGNPAQKKHKSESPVGTRGKGFTLVELLIVISIFVLIATIVLGTLVVVLRGSKNSDSIILVKQNGNYAMTQMVRMIRFAKSLDNPAVCDGATLNSITITTFDLKQTTFSCPVNPLPTLNFIASNSANSTKLTNMQTVGVSSCAFVCTQSGTGPPLIKITFSLKKINSNGLTEGDITIPFQSSVTMRNLGMQ